MLRSWSFIVIFSVLHLSYAITVYLHPQTTSFSPELSPEKASFAISRHLDLELFEPLPLQDSSQPYEDIIFLGQNAGSALVVTLDSLDASVLPTQLVPSFSLDTPSGSINSLSSVLYTCLPRARRIYESVYEGSGALWQLSELDNLSAFFESQVLGFAAIELRELSDIRLKYGVASDEYQAAAYHVRNFFKHALEHMDNLRFAILTYSKDLPQKREFTPRQDQSPLPPSQPPPQQPIGSISTCFTDENVCRNATNSCSGRGKCVEASKSGRTCFVCTCGVTRTGEGAKVKTEIWVGESCERKDISAPFVLLTGSAAVLLFLVIGSISLLSGVGHHELPSTLLGTTVLSKKE
ncbi:hypothetical protein AX17_003989 [Amanita inopinata Kibby_2008]|nr:hypothetical protein AX17_003989 [Amanita inopinata Kibby_2008]